jgi:hypothetical protein
MPGLGKIGFTYRPPERRARELGGSSTPHPPDVGYEACVRSPERVERAAHDALAMFRDGREWFTAPVETAAAEIRRAAGQLFISESYKRTTGERAEQRGESD